MTKEELIPICMSFYKNQQIEQDKLFKVLSEFMQDKDIEKYKQIESYLPNIFQHPFFIMNAGMYILEALEYFENKFDLHKCYLNDTFYTII